MQTRNENAELLELGGWGKAHAADSLACLAPAPHTSNPSSSTATAITLSNLADISRGRPAKRVESVELSVTELSSTDPELASLWRRAAGRGPLVAYPCRPRTRTFSQHRSPGTGMIG